MRKGILFPGVLLCTAVCGTVAAQTRIDLGGQGRNYDFSNAILTKPFKTATVLPASCSVGETVFLTTATPGQNLNGCVATNTWIVLSGAPADNLPPIAGQSGKVLSNNGSVADWRSFGGDVTGAANALSVGRIQNRVVSAAAPSAGQALVWNASASQWEPGAVGGGGSLPPYTPARTSDTVLTLPAVGAYTFRFGTMACAAPVAASTVTIGGGTGTIWIAMNSDCTVKVRHNVIATCSSDCTPVAGASGFDTTDHPLYEWTVVSGVLASSGISRLTPYAAMPLLAGPNITLAASGGVTTISASGGGSGGSSSYPPLAADSTAYQYEEFIGGGDCSINVSNISKLGWRTASTIGGESLSCSTSTAPDRPGTVTINTSTTAGNEVALWLPSGPIHPGSTFTARFFFKLTSSTSVQALVGLVNNVWQSNSGTTSGLYLEKESGDSNWFATTESSSTRTRTDTGVGVNTGWVVAQIRRIDASTIGFKIAATVAALDTASESTITTNIPSALMFPAFTVGNTTTSAREMAVDFYDIRIAGLSR
jgi:hypothetical protein